MPINNYGGDTFVAFLDISGFKELMRNEKEAWKALDKLYQHGYEILRNQNNECRVDGIFISDSGVLFVRRNNRTLGNSESLRSLLTKIKRINERMRESDFMLTTSIAYGRFGYQERIEFEGIEKNLIYNNAYVSAFLDNENGKPRIQPGQCRIVKKNLPEDVTTTLQSQDNEVFRMIRERDGDNQHYYYYWMVDEASEIKRFEQNYKDAYNLKYAGILKALKGDRPERHIR